MDCLFSARKALSTFLLLFVLSSCSNDSNNSLSALSDGELLMCGVADPSETIVNQLSFDGNIAGNALTIGAPRVGSYANGYLVGEISYNGVPVVNLFGPDTLAENITAAEIAAALNTLDGVSATAETVVILDAFNVAGWPAEGLTGLVVSGNTIADSQDLAQLRINLEAVGYVVESDSPNSLSVYDADGEDITIDVSGMNSDGVGQPRFNVNGPANGVTVDALVGSGNQVLVTVGGTVTIRARSDIELSSDGTAGENFWADFTSEDATPICAQQP